MYYCCFFFFTIHIYFCLALEFIHNIISQFIWWLDSLSVIWNVGEQKVESSRKWKFSSTSTSKLCSTWVKKTLYFTTLTFAYTCSSLSFTWSRFNKGHYCMISGCPWCLPCLVYINHSGRTVCKASLVQSKAVLQLHLLLCYSAARNSCCSVVEVKCWGKKLIEDITLFKCGGTVV